MEIKEMKTMAVLAVLVMAFSAVAVIADSSDDVVAGGEDTNEAKIGDTGYATLEVALNIAGEGAEVLILKDISLEAQLTIDKSITIDGQGHKISIRHNGEYPSNGAAILVMKSVIFKNVVIDGPREPSDNMGWESNRHTMKFYGGESELENVTIKGGSEAVQVSGQGTKLTLSGTIGFNQNCYNGIEVKDGATLNVSGVEKVSEGAIIWIDKDQTGTVVTGDKASVTKPDSAGQTKYVFSAPVAKIGNGDSAVGYAMLKEAIESANSGETVTVLKDITWNVGNYSLFTNLPNSGMTLTIDGNNHKMTIDGNNGFAFSTNVNLAAVTISNFEFVAGNGAYSAIYLNPNNGACTISNCKFTGTFTGAPVVIDGSNPACILNVKINGCTFPDNAKDNLDGDKPAATRIAYFPGSKSTIEVDNNPLDLAAAKIGDTCYPTLVSAFASVTGTTATTIEILRDCAGGGIFLDDDVKRNITVDFGGHTYTCNTLVGSSGTVRQAFHLEKGNTVKLENGTIAMKAGLGNSRMIIQNYANLTLDRMTLDGSNLEFDGTRYTMSNNCGQVSIVDTKIIAVGSQIALDSCKYESYEVPTVTISETAAGRTVITGKVEVTGGSLIIKGGVFNGNILVGAGNMTVDDGCKLDVLSGYKLEIEDGATMTIKGETTNYGTLEINANATFDVQSTVVNNGLVVDNASWNPKVPLKNNGIVSGSHASVWGVEKEEEKVKIEEKILNDETPVEVQAQAIKATAECIVDQQKTLKVVVEPKANVPASVEFPGGTKVPANTIIAVAPVKQMENAFEVSFAGVQIPQGEKVRITLPAESSDTEVFFINGDGRVPMTVVSRTSSSVTFETDHNSTYLVVSKIAEPEEEVDDTDYNEFYEQQRQQQYREWMEQQQSSGNNGSDDGVKVVAAAAAAACAVVALLALSLMRRN